MKDIKDYLHLYLGCQCVTKWGVNASLVSIWNSKSDYIPRPICKVLRDDAYGVTIDVDPSDLLLILRPLSDMTEEERIEVASMVSPGEDPMWVKHIAMTTKWYLSKGFDLFGLIEAGLAIDKTTLKQN